MKKTVPLTKKVSQGLMGALAMAGGSAAYGDVVVVTPPPNLVPSVLPLEEPTPGSGGISLVWDVNSDGTDDFEFTFRQPESATGVDWQANIFPLSGAFTFGMPATFVPGAFYTHCFSLGETIDGTAPPAGNVVSPSPTQGIMASVFGGPGGTYYGDFQPPTSRGFVGFGFTTVDGTFYGYLELRTTRASMVGDPGIEFFSAAYDNTSLTPIQAGAIPEPGTLALLAFGAAGVAAVNHRRKRKQKVG